MNVPPIVQRHRALRWLVPAGVVGLGALVATGMFKAGADIESLPATTPAALLAQVQQTSVDGFSGTVVSHFDLGVPALPQLAPAGAGDDTSLSALLTGSHTLQVWYGGADKQRVALLGPTEETDVFRNGPDLWQWNSADRTAVHFRVPADRDDASSPPSPAASLTPDALARSAIAAVNPSTKVTVHKGETVADRSAYELVLTPRAVATKIGSVHIAVDGQTKVPLGVQVYAKQASTPAVDVAFTSIRFGQQSERNFEFSPPPDAQVRPPRPPSAGAAGELPPKVIGSGWTAVVRLATGKKGLASFGRGMLDQATTPVSGAWGKGRLLDGALLTVLFTDDGRLYAGPVGADTLYAAAGR